MTVDIMFPCFNRLEFTQYSWAMLIRNTPWEQIGRVHVYDDGSTDGTRGWIESQLEHCPVQATLTFLGHQSPVAAMNHMVQVMGADWFAKIDNDTCVPHGWLDALLSVLEQNPSVDLIGMEAGMTRVAGRDGEPWDGTYSLRPSSHIGGVGLMRRRVFQGQRMRADGRYGFTEYQYKNYLARGWIEPDLPLVQLDRLPFEPWASLTRRYIDAGWSREWEPWTEQWMGWAWDWLPSPESIGLDLSAA